MTSFLETELLAVGALKQGHFLLASGLHSDRYIEKFDLLRSPGVTSRILQYWVSQFTSEHIDVVAGPTTGGVILSFELARQLGCKSAYAERIFEGEKGREFRRGTSFARDARVLIVDDILTTGGSIRETIGALEQHPVKIIGIAVLVDRSNGATTFGQIPLTALLTLDVKAWEPDNCPLCRDGVRVVKPGTTVVDGGV
ncbi:orotate phosphoribosyltransferase [soil metagenome]